MKTILITGCSSGFGFETANYFLSKGWRVIATMRNPADSLLQESQRLRILSLDVSDISSIENIVELTGPIDVLVNNAGIGVMGALEGITTNAIHDVFAVNVLGTINLTKAFLPLFRAQKSGVIINVSSAITLVPLPLLSVYTASKAAINAFTESLAIELEQFNVRVNLVLPGRAPATRFGENSKSRMATAIPQPYTAIAQSVFNNRDDNSITHTEDVINAIWQAANNSGSPMKILAGKDAKSLAKNS
ncbi:short-subunit dehydrogenase [Vibrio diazotrophicus]|uniref:Short-subunit dehydrogenase n=1 Tax=Vibrio diazotrophicus TaxID=685 RepID=A0A329DW89_VIBDI|nr:SDR family oxidoreductase [Vibrio diazotrophicus]RAS53237.1 short-subunit dehydrogenase [Vibrio diazotrophicus]